MTKHEYESRLFLAGVMAEWHLTLEQDTAELFALASGCSGYQDFMEIIHDAVLDGDPDVYDIAYGAFHSAAMLIVDAIGKVKTILDAKRSGADSSNTAP
jgi:hypothetical protein